MISCAMNQYKVIYQAYSQKHSGIFSAESAENLSTRLLKEFPAWEILSIELAK